jgi:hypothetical protein
MQKDLTTSIIIAILGVVGAFFIVNMMVGEISEVTIKSVDSSFGIDIPEPDDEVFNYKAINPTVEVYVGNNNGDCAQLNSDGNCIYSTDQGTTSPDSNQGTTNPDSEQGE